MLRLVSNHLRTLRALGDNTNLGTIGHRSRTVLRNDDTVIAPSWRGTGTSLAQARVDRPTHGSGPGPVGADAQGRWRHANSSVAGASRWRESRLGHQHARRDRVTLRDRLLGFASSHEGGYEQSLRGRLDIPTRNRSLRNRSPEVDPESIRQRSPPRSPPGLRSGVPSPSRRAATARSRLRLAVSRGLALSPGRLPTRHRFDSEGCEGLRAPPNPGPSAIGAATDPAPRHDQRPHGADQA